MSCGIQFNSEKKSRRNFSMSNSSFQGPARCVISWRFVMPSDDSEWIGHEFGEWWNTTLVSYDADFYAFLIFVFFSSFLNTQCNAVVISCTFRVLNFNLRKQVALMHFSQFIIKSSSDVFNMNANETLLCIRWWLNVSRSAEKQYKYFSNYSSLFR